MVGKNGVEEKKWRAEVVSTFEARRRKRDGEPVARRDFGPNARFVFSPALREALKLGDGRLMVISCVSKRADGAITLEFREHNDGRSGKQLKAEGRSGLILTSGQFKAKGLRKVRIDVLGNVYPANERAAPDGAARSS